MTSLTFWCSNGQVYMADGPWEARLTPKQCGKLLDIWEEAGAVSAFNGLYQACQAAGHPEHVISTPALRLRCLDGRMWPATPEYGDAA